jgi:hypothetical protein
MNEDELLWAVMKQEALDWATEREDTLALLRGDLKDFHFPDLLVKLYRTGKTGVLTVTRERVKKQVFIREGAPCLARSNLKSELLGEFLVARNKISREQQQEALERHREKRIAFTAALIETGAIGDRDLFLLGRRQFLTILYSLFGLREGRYRFDEIEVSEMHFRYQADFSKMLNFGIRQITEVRVLEEMVGDLDQAPVQTDRFPEHQQMAFTIPELSVIKQIDSERSIRKIIETTGFDTTSVLKTVLILFHHQCIRLRLDFCEEEIEPIIDLEDAAAASLGFQKYQPSSPEEESSVLEDASLTASRETETTPAEPEPQEETPSPLEAAFEPEEAESLSKAFGSEVPLLSSKQPTDETAGWIETLLGDLETAVPPSERDRESIVPNLIGSPGALGPQTPGPEAPGPEAPTPETPTMEEVLDSLSDSKEVPPPPAPEPEETIPAMPARDRQETKTAQPEPAGEETVIALPGPPEAEKTTPRTFLGAAAERSAAALTAEKPSSQPPAETEGPGMATGLVYAALVILAIAAGIFGLSKWKSPLQDRLAATMSRERGMEIASVTAGGEKVRPGSERAAKDVMQSPDTKVSAPGPAAPSAAAAPARRSGEAASERPAPQAAGGTTPETAGKSGETGAVDPSVAKAPALPLSLPPGTGKVSKEKVEESMALLNELFNKQQSGQADNGESSAADQEPRTAAVQAPASGSGTASPSGTLGFSLLVNAVPVQVRSGETLTLYKKDTLVLEDVTSGLSDNANLRMNFIGFVGNPEDNVGDDRGFVIRPDSLMPRRALDKAGTLYRVEARAGNRLLGEMYVRVPAAAGSSPQADSVVFSAPDMPDAVDTRTQIVAVRHTTENGHHRVVVELDGPANFAKHALLEQNMIFVSVKDTRLASALDKDPIVISSATLKTIRMGQYKPGIARVVLDFNKITDVQISSATNPNRIVLDVAP